MAHVGVQIFASQSEKFYSDINHTYILVGHTTRTYKIVTRFSAQNRLFSAFCASLWLGMSVVIAAWQIDLRESKKCSKCMPSRACFY